MAFRIHHFEYSRMTFSALVWEKHLPHRCAQITVLPGYWSQWLGPPQEIPMSLGTTMVIIMRPRVALGFTLNMFQF